MLTLCEILGLSFHKFVLYLEDVYIFNYNLSPGFVCIAFVKADNELLKEFMFSCHKQETAITAHALFKVN